MPLTRRYRQYYVELGAALALYMALLFGAVTAEHAFHPAGAAKMALLLTPMIGVCALAWAIMRMLWRLDEMKRRVLYEAIAIAFLGTAVISLGWGFAELAGAPRLPTFAIWPIMGVLMVIGKAVAMRRYR